MRFNEFKIVEPSSSSDESVKYVLVQKRDSLYRIAKALKISLADLIAANPQIKDPDLIHPGDKINVPGNTAPNPVYPEIPRGRPTMKDDPRLKPSTEKPEDPKDDGSYDRAERARLGWLRTGETEPPKTEPPKTEPPKSNVDSTAGAGRGKINPGSIGKGQYQIGVGLVATTWHVFDFFKKNGFNDVQSAAITANAYYESERTLSGDAKGDYIKHTGIPTAFGIFQWRLDRAVGLRAFAITHRKSWKDLDLQLEWAMHELNGKYKNVKDALNSGKNKTDVAAATMTFMKQYENPSATHHHYEDRLGYARVILDAFGTKQDKKPA
jgi:LysM repeat protein